MSRNWRKLAKAEGKSVAVRFPQQDRSFSVTRRTYMGEVGVRFILRDEQIAVESVGLNMKFSAGLTLNDAGTVASWLTDRWQLLRRVLEPVLFWSSE